jgi:hypothetical protein
MMKKQVLASLGALALGLAFQVQAAPVGGSMDKVTNGCISPIPFYVGDDCSYNGAHPIVGMAGLPSYIGPIAAGSLFEPMGSAAGLANKRLRVDGDLVITGTGNGAMLSGTFSIAAGEHLTDCAQGSWCNESWDSFDHTIVPVALKAPETKNSAGGYDYELTTFGAPDPMLPCVPYFPFNCSGYLGKLGFNYAAQVFPSVTPSQFYAGTSWIYPPPGLGFATLDHGETSGTDADSLQAVVHAAPNLGTTTTATIVNWQCEPQDPDNPALCINGALWGVSPGIENLQAKISTNAAGTILNAAFSVSQEFQTLPFGNVPHPDSFEGNYIALSGIEATGQNDVQIDKKNNFNVVIKGSDAFDVRSIDVASLRLGPGLFVETFPGFPQFGPNLGTETHQKAHISGGDLTAHFASNASDLQCGVDQVKLRGTSDGVPFVVSVRVNGIGKACRPVEEE